MMFTVTASRKAALRFKLKCLNTSRKWLSSPAGAVGNSLSGRSRFYKEVGIQYLEIPPWEGIEKVSSLTAPSIRRDDSFVLPISTGVDGPQSATGIHRIPQSEKTPLSLKQILTPRCPGQEPTINDDNNNTSWYSVTLDGRKVSTPMGKILAVPSETLAFMIAAEWDSQMNELQPSKMPLMTLACTSLDQATVHPQFYRDMTLQYLPTDTVRAVLV